MKNLLLFSACMALLCLRPISGRTQASQPEFHNHVEDLKIGPDGAPHLILYSVDEVTGAPHILAQRLAPGSPPKTIILLSRGTPLGYDILPVGNGYIVAASFFQCDVELPWHLYKFNWEGNLQWEKELSFTDNPHDQLKLLPGPGNMVWIFRAGLAPLLYTAAGTMYQTGPLPLPLFDGFRPTADGRFLTYGPDGLAVYNNTLTSFQLTLKNNVLLSAEALPDGGFIALSADSLYRLAADFTVKKAVAHQIASTKRISLTSNGSQLLAYAASRFQRFDITSLSLLETVTVPVYSPFQPALMTAAGGQIWVAGEELAPAGNILQVVEMRAFDFNETPDFSASADAALQDIVFPAPASATVYTHPFLPPVYSIKVEGAYASVKNEGSAPLQRVNLNSILHIYDGLCGAEITHYRDTFQNLNLMPGESAQLPLGTLSWSISSGNLPASVSVCLWTTLPNDSLDADRTNNYLCRSASVVVATQTPAAKTQALQISPNPSAGACTIQWANGAFDPASLCLYDLAGRLIQEIEVVGAGWTLEQGFLPPGCYLVAVRNATGQRFTGRLVVEW